MGSARWVFVRSCWCYSSGATSRGFTWAPAYRMSSNRAIFHTHSVEEETILFHTVLPNNTFTSLGLQGRNTNSTAQIGGSVDPHNRADGMVFCSNDILISRCGPLQLDGVFICGRNWFAFMLCLCFLGVIFYGISI